jgi:hypothetical protein
MSSWKEAFQETKWRSNISEKCIFLRYRTTIFYDERSGMVKAITTETNLLQNWTSTALGRSHTRLPYQVSTHYRFPIAIRRCSYPKS